MAQISGICGEIDDSELLLAQIHRLALYISSFALPPPQLLSYPILGAHSPVDPGASCGLQP